MEIQIDGDLWNLPNGSTYDFDDNTLTNRIDLYVYEGPTIASQVPGDFDQYWTRLKTTGSFEIVDKIESNTDKSIIGKINMDVFYEDEFLFHIEDMIFNSGSFE